MTKYQLHVSLVLAFLPCMAAAQLIELELLNKSDVPLEYKEGIRRNPPTTIGIQALAAGKSAKFMVDAGQFPQLLIREQGKAAIAYIFEFTPTDATTKMRIRFVDDKKGPRIEPQTSLGMAMKGNITADQIVLIGQAGQGYAPQKPVTPAPKRAVEDKPLPVPTLPPIETAPEVPEAPPLVKQASIPQAPPMGPVVPQAPPMTRAASIPTAPPLTVSAPEAPAAPKVSGPVMSADLQAQIQAGKALKKVTPDAQPAATQQSDLAKGLAARRSMLATEDEEESGEEDKSVQIAQLAKEIKQAFADEKRLNDDIAHKIATVYVDYPPVNFATDKKVRQDITRRISEMSPSARAMGPIALPNVKVPAASAA